MIRTHAATTIARPVDEVFAFAADLEHDPLWRSEVCEMTRLSGGPGQVGATYRQVIDAGGRRIESELRVADLEADRRMVVVSTSGPIDFRIEATFEPVEGGTRVTFDAEFRLTGVLRFVEGAVRPTVQRRAPEAPAGLKAVLER